MTIYTIETYRDRAKGWRVRIRHRNGRIILVSGEGYRRRADALRALSRLMSAPYEAFRLVALTEAKGRRRAG